jgi:hypothetical protein
MVIDAVTIRELLEPSQEFPFAPANFQEVGFWEA